MELINQYINFKFRLQEAKGAKFQWTGMFIVHFRNRF